jgi:acetamidase/formamidase
MSDGVHGARHAAAHHHYLRATPEHVHWGYLDPELEPVLTIGSGDRVAIDTVSGGLQDLPPEELGFQILDDHLAILRAAAKGAGNHIYTGPIYVEEAEPGDVLEVRTLDIQLRQDWGWNAFRPLLGTLPDEFPYFQRLHIPLDRQNMTATMPWGLKVPLRPFFGQLAVAPRPEFGRQGSKEPREFGGNMDCRELGVGSTVYLPVWTRGALFSAGDGHALQGDGEVCNTAVETALTGTFEFLVRKDLHYRVPRAETATHYITLGFDVDLDDAARQALHEMVEWVVTLLEIPPGHAYAFCSFVADLHVTQTVNNVKGVHAMIEKRLMRKA